MEQRQPRLAAPRSVVLQLVVLQVPVVPWDEAQWFPPEQQNFR
jgi:hypothetical protein